MFVNVCAREREREREKDSMCVCTGNSKVVPNNPRHSELLTF